MAANEDFKIAEEVAQAKPKTKKMYTLIVDEQEGELNYLPIGVDGKVYQIMRGVEVEVPEEVISILKNCKATRLVKEHHDGKDIYVPRDYSTIPYRVMGSREV